MSDAGSQTSEAPPFSSVSVSHGGLAEVLTFITQQTANSKKRLTTPIPPHPRVQSIQTMFKFLTLLAVCCSAHFNVQLTLHCFDE